MEVDSDAEDPLLANGDASSSSSNHENQHEISTQNGNDDSGASANPSKTICEECEDRRAQWFCPECEGNFCDVCFYALHRKGKRALHRPKKINRPIAAGDGARGADRGGGSGGGLLKGWIGPRLPPKEEVNPDIHDRWVGQIKMFVG